MLVCGGRGELDVVCCSVVDLDSCVYEVIEV